ncbi:MAG: hypothetical protein MJ095_09570 [Oscillospiraceae bacterium]|nr:hypothetical protein [Oscillospiraceae bacterium]
MKKGEYLYGKLGEVDEKYIDEAENYTKKSENRKNKSVSSGTKTEKVEGVIKITERKRRLLPAAIAACFAVTAVSLPLILSRNSVKVPSSDISEVTQQDSSDDENVQEYTDEQSEENNQCLPSSIYEMNSQTNEYELVYRSMTDGNTEDDGFRNPDIYSWPVETAISEISDYLREKNNLEYRNEGFEMFRTGGYELYLTTDRDIQEHLDDVYSDWHYFPEVLSSVDDEPIQSAFVVMDYSGHILGIEGQLGTKTCNLGWNAAYEGGRQIGAAITPVASYGYALENDIISYSSYHRDTYLPEGTVEGFDNWPLNYDGAPSEGSYPAYYFLKNSINTLPAQILYNNGSSIIHEVFDFATRKLHLDLDPDGDADYAPLALGYTKTGPGVINLANAYMPYGNGGKYYKASIISRCVAPSGEVIIDNENREGEQAVSEETAYIMNKMLTDVVEKGTGTAAQLWNTPVAGKTGSTENWRDILFVGMTPDYLSAVWIGYDKGENEWAIERANSAGIWRSVFGTYANENSSGRSFPECESVSEEKYCAATGLKASEGCTEGGTGYFKAGDPYCTFCGGQE